LTNLQSFGYVKLNYGVSAIKPEMSNISVTNNANTDNGIGAIYYTYLQQLDKIETENKNINITKQIAIVKQNDAGEFIEPLKADANGKFNNIKIGDKLRITLIVKTDRSMDYVHIKDGYSGATEPINVLSNYEYKNGVGYYQSTKDVATHFYFNSLPKGDYTFNYDLFVTHAGEFINGIAQLQCMYAPEFTAFSKGSFIKVSK
jgi:hypothetical protein